jgi:hypothetical protein
MARSDARADGCMGGRGWVGSGQTAQTQEMSPIKIVKNPDGSLQRAALTQAALAKERREMRDTQRNMEMDALPKDLNKPWLDPMPEPGERNFAQDLRGAVAPIEDVPEWKKSSFGKHSTFGRITDLSIKEQRCVQCDRDATGRALEAYVALRVLRVNAAGRPCPFTSCGVSWCTPWRRTKCSSSSATRARARLVHHAHTSTH